MYKRNWKQMHKTHNIDTFVEKIIMDLKLAHNNPCYLGSAIFILAQESN